MIVHRDMIGLCVIALQTRAGKWLDFSYLWVWASANEGIVSAAIDFILDSYLSESNTISGKI